jgi:hypothetical protein
MNSLKPASFGSVSHGTLRTEDLLSAFSSELEWQIGRNGAFLSMPENFALRDRLAKLLGEAQDAWQEDGETLQDEDLAAEMVNELQDALSDNFAPAYGYFGAHCGDGSDFGFWLGDIEDIKSQVGFVSVSDRASASFKESAGCDSEDSSRPADSFRGEWLHVNDHGNATLYIRNEDGKDSEVWSIV